MSKPIIATISQGLTTDEVTYIEDGEEKKRIGLCKRVSEDFLQQPFRELVSYLCCPDEDEFNNKYSESETKLAQRIEHEIGSKSVFLTATKPSGYQVNGIELESLVGDHYKDIRQVTEIRQDGETIPVESIDLLVQRAISGGKYLPYV